MHTAERLDAALQVARKLGYHVRMEWLDGHSGGACHIAGKKVLFVDLALTVDEQLEVVMETLRAEAERQAAGKAAAETPSHE